MLFHELCDTEMEKGSDLVNYCADFSVPLSQKRNRTTHRKKKEKKTVKKECTCTVSDKNYFPLLKILLRITLQWMDRFQYSFSKLN